MSDLSVWSVCWWLGTMLAGLAAIAVGCVFGLAWAAPLILASFLSCAADAAWGWWE